MKHFLLFISALFVLISCGNSKQASNSLDHDNNNVFNSQEMEVEVKKNTVYTIAQDITGATYPEFENGNATTLIFKYVEKGPLGTADGDYTEMVYMSIPKDISTKKYSDANLQTTNVLFGKFCFCKGEAGFYEVKEGTLSIKNKKESIEIDFSFKIIETSHKVSAIKQTIIL